VSLTLENDACSEKTSYFQKEGFMKIHNDFTLYWRVFPSGKRVVYYYAYDENGARQMGRSTGETNMTAARVKCNRLLKEGKLIPNSGYMPTFAEYAEGWWEWETCAYLKKRRKRYSLTQAYADNNKKNLKNQLLKYFGDMPLNKITKDDVEAWFDKLIEDDYQNTSINGYYGTLKTMLIEAVERKILPKDPTEKMGRLVNDRREIKIITPREFKKLFTGDWRRVWDNNRISFTANKLACQKACAFWLESLRCNRKLHAFKEWSFAKQNSQDEKPQAFRQATGKRRQRTNTIFPCLMI
jgi:hypothetical protein